MRTKSQVWKYHWYLHHWQKYPVSSDIHNRNGNHDSMMMKRQSAGTQKTQRVGVGGYCFVAVGTRAEEAHEDVEA